MRSSGQQGATFEHGRLESLTQALRKQERELDRLRREADPVGRARDQRLISSQAEEIARLRTALRTRDSQVQRLQAARRSEADPRAMQGHALDAFNASEHADRMARIARTLGEPDVSVDDQGPGLPRQVHVTLVWDIAWYRFAVKLDLGSGRAAVREIDNGGDPRKVPTAPIQRNATWRDSGLVLS